MHQRILKHTHRCFYITNYQSFKKNLDTIRISGKNRFHSSSGSMSTEAVKIGVTLK